MKIRVDPDELRELAELRASDLADSTLIRAAADQLEAVRQEVSNYAGWYEYSPEDSWRLERDLRTALGMEQYEGGDDD